MYLLDSNIIIWHLRHHKEVTLFLARLADDAPLAFSPVSRFEVQAGMRDQEMKQVNELFSTLVEIPLESDAAAYAGNLWREYRKKGITLGTHDVMLAATAILQDLRFVTLDRRGFPMPELRLVSVPNF